MSFPFLPVQEVASFDQHLTYLVGFLAFLEAYVALFGHAALRRVNSPDLMVDYVPRIISQLAYT